MKNIKILLGLIILIFGSCSKREFTSDIPTIPEPIEIDIDEDGVADYRIEYSPVLVEGPSISEGIVGHLKPYGKNEILNERQGRDLFLRKLEDITQNVSEPIFWSNTSNVSIVSLYNHSPTNEWQIKWNVHSEDEHSSYFIGLKMIGGNISQLAWVEIEITPNNGIISILNKGIL